MAINLPEGATRYACQGVVFSRWFGERPFREASVLPA
jgi:hypothetical protein